MQKPALQKSLSEAQKPALQKNLSEKNSHLIVLEAVLEAIEIPGSVDDQIQQVLEILISLQWGSEQSRLTDIYLIMKQLGQWQPVISSGPLEGCQPDVSLSIDELKALFKLGSAALISGVCAGCQSDPSTEGCYSLPVFRGSDQLYGVLMFKMPGNYICSNDDERLLRLVARILGRLAERERAGQEIHQLTKRLIGLQEQEYRKLARELHDELGQSLTAIKSDAVLISNRSKGRERPVYQSAEAIIAVVSHIYDVVYSMMRRLRPSVLDDLGLVATLESYVKDWQKRRPGLPCHLRVLGDVDGLGEDINITIYRVVQECTTNAVRHAAASQVNVKLERLTDEAGDFIMLSVSDNGRGLAQGSRSKLGGGFGLLGMRERVEGLSGKFTVESIKGKGVTVHSVIPVTNQA
ncbi:MAG: hypothetical protein IME93_03410 [Proteobacteria bacterium]|nr:hypothetical protein [Pseudomonadota bacterium]